MFTAQTIRNRVRQQPFVPMRIVTTTGNTYDVRHPDMIWVTTNYINVGIPSSTDPTLPGDATMVAVLHITEIQDLPQAKPATGTNGPA